VMLVSLLEARALYNIRVRDTSTGSICYELTVPMVAGRA
jgi:hypothetical protein